jgi:hypothetical protein
MSLQIEKKKSSNFQAPINPQVLICGDGDLTVPL